MPKVRSNFKKTDNDHLIDEALSRAFVCVWLHEQLQALRRKLGRTFKAQEINKDEGNRRCFFLLREAVDQLEIEYTEKWEKQDQGEKKDGTG